MEKEKINWRDAYEVAAVLCGIDPDSDAYKVEDALADKFEIDPEIFEKILQQLFDHIDFGISPITQEPYVGFTREEKGELKAWMIKKECNQEFIHSVIGWISEGKKLTEEKPELVKTITSKGNPIYEVVLRNSTPEFDWNKLREEFFTECTDVSSHPNTPDLKVVNMTPHDLFEWFKKKVQK